MKKLVIICTLILIHCNPIADYNSYTLEPVKDSIYIRLGTHEINHTRLNQYFIDKGTNYLALLNDDRHSIYLYNLDQKVLYKEIVINKEGPDGFPGLFGYTIKNLDTIVLISNWPASVGVFNSDAKLIKNLSLFPDTTREFIPLAIPMYGQKPFLIGNKLFALHELAIKEYKGKFEMEDQQKVPMVISADIINNEIKIMNLKYPKELIGKDIFNIYKCWELGSQNCVVFSMSIFNDIFLSKDTTNLNTIKLNTEYSMKLPENMSKFATDLNEFLKYEQTKDIIWEIKYDKFREVYYILIRKRAERIENIELSAKYATYPDCFILILNKEFKHLGEVHFPINVYNFNNIFITEKGVFISEDHVDNPTYNEDVMRFRLFKLKTGR